MFVCHLSNNSAVVGVLHGTWDNFKFTKVVKFTAVIRCVIKCNHNGQRKVRYSFLSSPFLKVCGNLSGHSDHLLKTLCVSQVWTR